MTELLSKLAPHMKWPNGEGAGGGVAISAQDVAAACRGMTRHIYLYALVKFVFDTSVVNELYAENRRATVYRAHLQRWRALDLGIEVIHKMADLSLREAIIPPHCAHCNGAGIHNNQRSCKECGGSGIRHIERSVRARFCGVSLSQWDSVCAHRYDELQREFDYFESLIASIVKRRLKDDEA